MPTKMWESPIFDWAPATSVSCASDSSIQPLIERSSSFLQDSVIVNAALLQFRLFPWGSGAGARFRLLPMSNQNFSSLIFSKRKQLFTFRQFNYQLGADFGVSCFDWTAHFGDDSVGNRQPQSCSFADFLGCEKGLKNAVQNIFRKTAGIIFDNDSDFAGVVTVVYF